MRSGLALARPGMPRFVGNGWGGRALESWEDRHSRVIDRKIRMAITAWEYGPRAHAAPVWRARVVGMVPAHDKDASEIIIATVTVDHDSEYHFTLCLRSICSRSPAQLEARSTSLVDTFSSRAELRGLSRFPPSSCRARARVSTFCHTTRHPVRNRPRAGFTTILFSCV